MAAIDRLLWRADKPGKISDLHLVSDRLPPPSSGEVRVAIKAIGLNFADVFTCLGLYSASPKGNYTPGLEFAGLIEAVGVGVSEKQIGRKVFGITRFGAYASHINANLKYVQDVPEGWSFTEAAAFPVQGLTIIYAIRELGDMKQGQTLLLHSAAGGCGSLALGICKELKINVIGTVGHANKVHHLISRWGPDFLPEDRIILRKGGNKIFKEQLLSVLSQMGSEGVDCVLDAIQGDYFHPGYEVLVRGGRYVVYGAASMTPPGNSPNWLSLAWKYLKRPVLDPLKMMSDNKSVMAFNLIWMFDKVEKMESLLQELQALNLEAPLVGETFEFQNAQAALKKLQSGLTIGKVVITC
ncbi:hypothetical protein GOP47_0023711 [Adiantum capillus-veneris]|uniref:Enoyl reductase (ER) domain-containing protein n=1 Tax=Adiantum capillus-veneris TaxID=13818 RepID=A0A9D4U405_ADICA|nr:hypothetical protein GOP47_0023711 [Adiantum capillus-veneris]